jgi:7-keto-8-aminopelargonate synthetase-like enzyme
MTAGGLERLGCNGFDCVVDSSTEPSTTHIIPLVLGENERTMAICEALLERGFYAQGIRHPSVPEGTARLRITPMATHEETEIDAFADALVDLVTPN